MQRICANACAGSKPPATAPPSAFDREAIKSIYDGGSGAPSISGDDQLTQRMYDMGQIDKRATMNRALWNVNTFLPYWQEELDDASNNPWWQNDSLENKF